MPPTNEDPRNYIEIKPIPEWKEAVDSRLKARNFINYTLEKPTRNNVFKANYARRTCQMQSQGYNSAAWRPYEEVGKPVYLDAKTMVQDSLGQEDESAKAADDDKRQVNVVGEREKDETREESGIVRPKSAILSRERNKSGKSLRPASAVTFAAKNKHREDLQDIGKDLSLMKDSISKVKMGQPLFSMFEACDDKPADIKGLQSGMRFHGDIGSETSRRDSAIPRPSSSVSLKQLARGASSRASIASIGSVASSSSPSALVARRAEIMKSLAEQARPYTPVHSNISYPVDTTDVSTRVWRQLCALHWILQACQLETKSEIQRHHKVMIPISECWDPLNPGGKTRDIRAVLEEKKNNTKWSKFTRTTTHKLGMKNRNRRKNTVYSYLTNTKKSSGDLRRVPSYASDVGGIRKIPSVASEMGNLREEGSTRQRQPSGFSIAPSIDDNDGDASGTKPSRPSSPGQSSVTTTIAGGTTVGSEYGDDESNVADSAHHVAVDSDKRRDREDWFVEKDSHEHLKKLLSTVKQSVLSEMQRRERTALFVAKSNNKLPLSVYNWSRTSYFKIGKEQVNISRIVVPAATLVTDYSEPKPVKRVMAAKIRPHTAAGTKRRDSAQTSANDPSSSGAATTPRSKPARPMSSPAKLAGHFNFKFSSAEKEKHLDEMREKFEEVGDSKALQLHNQLLEFEKRRKQRMEIKFETLSRTSSMHRDLKGMRKTAHSKILSEKLAKKKRSSAQPCDWYTTLLQNLPDEVSADESCGAILRKLSAIAVEMMDDVRKVTADALFCALRNLRPWELCSPDVSSAIEFVRETVVRLDPADFDEWREGKLGRTDVLMGVDSKAKRD